MIYEEKRSSIMFSLKTCYGFAYQLFFAYFSFQIIKLSTNIKLNWGTFLGQNVFFYDFAILVKGTN